MIKYKRRSVDNEKRREFRFTAVFLVFAILMLGGFIFVNAGTVDELTITFQDEALCSKVANELKTYKNNERDKAINYLIASGQKSVTIDKNNLQYIKKLNLSGSISSGKDSAGQIVNLSGISEFTYLEELYLDNNTKISKHVNSNSNIHEIYKLANLNVLSLSGTLIYNDDIYDSGESFNISNLSNLLELNLSSTNISSSGLKAELSGLQKLQKLNLSNN